MVLGVQIVHLTLNIIVCLIISFLQHHRNSVHGHHEETRKERYMP